MIEQYHSIEFLKNKIDTWSESSAVMFHTPHKKAYPEKAKYIWEPANTSEVEGFLHYGPKFAAYYSANGDEYVLSSELYSPQFDIDWNFNKKLYSLIDNNFKMVNPTGIVVGFQKGTYRTVMLNGVQYIYYRINHLDNGLGSVMMLSIPDTAALTKFVDTVDILLRKLKQVVDTEKAPGYPSIKIPQLLITNNIPYWRFFYQWKISADGCYARIVGEFQKYLQHLEKNNIAVDTNIENYAREKWKNTLGI